MPNQFIASRQEFQDTIESSFEKLIEDRLPTLIRKATEKKYYNISEACELLDCTRRHLLYLRQSEQINYVKNGKKIYFKREDLEDFFDRNYIEQAEPQSA